MYDAIKRRLRRWCLGDDIGLYLYDVEYVEYCGSEAIFLRLKTSLLVQVTRLGRYLPIKCGRRGLRAQRGRRMYRI